MTEWISTEQAAAIVGVEPDTLRGYARGNHGGIPQPERIGTGKRSVLRWDREAMERWSANRAGQGHRSDLDSPKTKGDRP